MDTFIIGTEADGDRIAIPIVRILYLREDPAFTEIHLEGGATVRLSERLEQLGFAMFKPLGEEQPTEEGVAP